VTQMTDPTDPIDTWLAEGVELLRPPAGTYQRVAGRARRRRTTRAITAVAGAAVLVVAVVAVPRLASSLLPGGNGTAAVSGGSGTPSPSQLRSSSRPSQHAVSTPPRSSASPATSGPATSGPPLSLGGSSQPAARDFRPTSVTFVGSSVGAVLGQAGSSCATRTCVSVAGTSTYGRTWYKVGAPAASPPRGSAGVSQIRFLDLLNGWAYGPQLFATHDGGQSWTRITDLPAGRVIDLATVGDRVFAVIATCSGTGQDYAANCTSFELYTASADSNNWGPVPGTAAGLPVSPGGLQITSQRGYLLAHGILYTGPVNGEGWHSVRTGPLSLPPCLQSPPEAGWQPGTGLLAPQGLNLFLVCTSVPGSKAPTPLRSLILYSSLDGGQNWQAAGLVLAAGTPTSLAVAPGGGVVLATSAGLYYSTGSPATVSWHQAGLASQAPGGGFAFVGMTTTLQGVAVPANAGLHEIFTTADGGRTWQSSVIP
jgi:hypothetical protein